MNQVILLGRMGNQQAKCNLPNGTPYIRFTMCTNEKNFGENADQSTWHECEAWGDMATIIDRLNIVKGQEIYVVGRLRTASKTAKASDYRSRTSVSICDIKVFPVQTKNKDYNPTATK